ncbi:MAG TPA: restriction endonuclease [Candidatus Hydrogenedentes bacterium]|nr:restriction endonuclease [Candidatus Hydrogenedentota bacterium]
MGIREGTIAVLQEAGEPLHAKEIAKRLLDKKLWSTEGKTPHATVSARLYSDIKKNGDKSPFVLVASQTFGLRELGAKPSSSPKPSVEPKVKASAKVYSFAEAAEKVLEQFSNKRPMHFRDITKKAMEQGWLDTEGKTPDATMGAQIYTAIKRAQRRGEQPRFVQHGKGVFGLGKWMGHGLSYEIEQHNRQVRQALRKRLLGLKPKEFEDLVGLLLVEMGFEDIEVVGRTGDGGIDVRAMLVVGDVIGRT